MSAGDRCINARRAFERHRNARTEVCILQTATRQAAAAAAGAAADMDRSMGLTTTIRLLAAAALLALASGQQQPAASCTASLLTSFTPCFSFLTSSNGSSGSPPTRECCRSLAALVDAGTGCACLVLTGAVPLGVPVNRTLAVSLPRACDSTSVPLQCRDTSAQSPATGPVAADTPPATPASPAAATTTPDAPTATAPVTQGREAVLPTSGSARRASARVAATPALLLLLAVAAALV